MNESDIEILDNYLDGELSPVENEMLWRRLAVEPEFAAELEILRKQRSQREQAWLSLEPAEHATAQVEYNIVRGARRQELLGSLWRGTGLAASLAACVLFGLTVGLLGHDRLMTGAPTGGNNPLVQDTSGGSDPGQGYLVKIYDTSGHVTEQRFPTYGEAKSFAEDFSHAQSSPSNSEPVINVPVEGKF